MRPGSSLRFALRAKKSLVAQQVVAFPCSAEETRWVDHFPCLPVAKHLCKCVGLSKSHLLGQESWIYRLQMWGQADFKCKGMNGGWQSFPPPSLCHYLKTWSPTPTPCTFRNWERNEFQVSHFLGKNRKPSVLCKCWAFLLDVFLELRAVTAIGGIQHLCQAPSDMTTGWGFCGMGLSPQLRRQGIVLSYRKLHAYLSGPKQPMCSSVHNVSPNRCWHL